MYEDISDLANTSHEPEFVDHYDDYQEKNEIKPEKHLCLVMKQQLTHNTQTIDESQYQIQVKIKHYLRTISYFNLRTKNQWKGILQNCHFLDKNFPLALLVIFAEVTKIYARKQVIQKFGIKNTLLFFTAILKTKRKPKKLNKLSALSWKIIKRNALKEKLKLLKKIKKQKQMQ